MLGRASRRLALAPTLTASETSEAVRLTDSSAFYSAFLVNVVGALFREFHTAECKKLPFFFLFSHLLMFLQKVQSTVPTARSSAGHC